MYPVKKDMWWRQQITPCPISIECRGGGGGLPGERCTNCFSSVEPLSAALPALKIMALHTFVQNADSQ